MAAAAAATGGATGEVQGTPCFTLVCLRQLEEEIPLNDDASIEASALSHDRRLLSLRDRRGRCLCYSCDAARPAFLLRQPVAQQVDQDVWLHLPAEKSVLLRQNALSEYPGMPCLVALQKGNAALTICIFSQIKSPEAEVIDAQTKRATGAIELEKSRRLFTWEESMLCEELPPNRVWRYTVPLPELLGLFPNCMVLLQPQRAGGNTASSADLSSATPAPAEQEEAISRSERRVGREADDGGAEDGDAAGRVAAADEANDTAAGQPPSPLEAPEAVGSVSATAVLHDEVETTAAVEDDAFEAEAACKHLHIRLLAAKPSSLAIILDDIACVLLDFGRHGVFVSQCFYLQQPRRPLADATLLPASAGGRGATPTPSPATAGPTAATVSPSGGGVGSGGNTSLSLPLRFCDLTACQDWIFAVTPPPGPMILIWSLTGIAFHAIPLGDFLGEGTYFTSLVVALDLLDMALCDNHHNVWILSLNEYFEGSPKGLDWELLRERQRCAEGIGVFDQIGKAYQEVSCFPEAFGITTFRSESGQNWSRHFVHPRRSGGNSSVMDCLVEGVPTYGIPIPGGAFGGVSGRLFGEHSSSEPVGAEGHGASRGLDNGTFSLKTSNAPRCSPLAWHERISETHDWQEVDRRWAIARAQRLRSSRGDGAGAQATSFGDSACGYGPMNMLNGFSVPAQHRLGDDDLHYSLCAALQKHAQRQFESRLPPWLSRVKLLLRTQPFNPPLLDMLRHGAAEGEKPDSDSSADDEDLHSPNINASASVPDAEPPSPTAERGNKIVHQSSVSSVGDSSPGTEASLAALRQGLTAAMGGCQGGRKAPKVVRPPVQVGRVKLSVTASDIFCEIWKKRKRRVGATSGDASDKEFSDGQYGICPWAVCVIPRLNSAPSRSSSPQVDHLTGGYLDPLLDGGGAAPAAPSAKRELTTFRSRRRWMSVVTQNHIWYMLDEDGKLYALLLRQSPVRVISNLLVFEQRAKASRLCALNGWNATQLPVLTLFLGLRFRELNEIRLSLSHLKPHQEMEACQMVMDFIHAGYSCASLTLPFSPSSPRHGTGALPPTNTEWDVTGLNAPRVQEASISQKSPLLQSAVNQERQPLDKRNGSGPRGTTEQLKTYTGSAQVATWPPPRSPRVQQSWGAAQPVQQQDGLSSNAPNSSAGPAGIAATSAASLPTGSQPPADRSFVSRLLEIAMQFVTKLIQTRVLQIQGSDGACRALTYLQPAHAASEPTPYAAMVHELSQLTVHMQSLRNLQQQLIWSFADDKAYDGGVAIQCPTQEATQDHQNVLLSKAGQLGSSHAELAKLKGIVENPKDQLAKMRTPDGREAVVRNALISGCVSSALILFHEFAQEEGKGSSGCGSQVFTEFKVTAGRLCYQLVCNQQVDLLFVAMHMLRHVGESVNRFFKAVAFHTAKRLVRRRLLKHLRHMSRLTKEEQDLISLVNLLELLHTNPCYTTEFNRMTTSLTTGRYPLRAVQEKMPPFCTWPAGGRSMLLVGLSSDGAIGGNVSKDAIIGDGAAAECAYEQQTSLRELPMSQRLPLELHDMWAGYQTPVMAAMLEVAHDARRAWNRLPCGDVDDLDAQPVLGLEHFHKASNLEGDQDATVADLREADNSEGDADIRGLAGTRTTCRHCQREGLKDDMEFEIHRMRESSGSSTEELCESLGLGYSGPKHHVMGYLHVTLSWMRRWSWATRARILMEKTHYQPHMIESLPWLEPPPEEGKAGQAWRKCWLDFLVAHQDWRGLAAWVRRMPLDRDDRVDNHGMSRVDLTHLEERGLPCCTAYTREILLQELGRRGIFCHADTQSFLALLRRLALCGRLFGEGTALADDSEPGSQQADDSRIGESSATNKDVGVLALDRLLPSRDVCPFHRFFIHLCIDRDLPSVMLLYLQNYKLATTMNDLKGLQLRYSTKPWASLLLVGRLGNAHLFAASLQHAAIMYGGADPAAGAKPNRDRKTSNGMSTWSDAEDVPLLPLNSLAGPSPKAFLATLMFAPVASAYAAADAPPESPWSLDLSLLWRVVQEYPTLREALFPPDAPTPFKEDSHHQSDPDAPASLKLSTSLVESVAKTNDDRCTQSQDPCLDVANLNHTSPHDVATSEAQDLVKRCAERSRRMRKDILSFKEDVSLSNLLSDVAAFDVKRALRPLPIFPIFQEDNADDLDDSVRWGSDGSLAALVEQGERFCDELGEGYFLAQGRAMMAFHVLLTKCARRTGPSAELRFPLVLQTEETRRLHKVAKSVALYNLLNEGVVSSAVCLLELCSLDTEMLRVDVQAAKRIYEHNMRQGSETADWDRSRQAAASVIELFLSFPDIEEVPSRAAEAAINSGHLLTALRMLEESTWALDPHPSAPSVSSLQALAYDSPWHLVALFCRVHSLPRSLTLLHELARNNDWVMFLHESDLQQCPADTVLDIVDGYFTDVSLQSHLRILARSIALQEQDDHGLHLKSIERGVSGGKEGVDQRQPEEQRTEDPGLKQRPETSPGRALTSGGGGRNGGIADAIGFLEQCRVKDGGSHVIGTGMGLLRHALNNRAARLAVTASAFSDVTPLQCMAVWLSVNTERSQTSTVQVEIPPTELAVQYSPAEVAGQIATLCRRSRAFSLVLRALKIFDPVNPVVDFVKFHRAFVQSRFQSCRGHLKRFVTRRDSELKAPAKQSSEGAYCLEVVPHVASLSEEMVQYLLDGFPQARMMLLSALDQADFSPHYSHLFRSFRLIQQAGLDVDFRVPASELLQLLISRKMFAEAREWARSSGLVGDTIVFEEVTGMIVEFRQGVWWNVLDERLQLWHECYCAFMRQNYPPVGAALFFLDISSKLEPDLFAREQLMLLCIAFELLCGSMPDDESTPTGNASPTTSAKASKQQQATSKEQLSRIKLSMLLILTGTNKDLAAELDFAPLDLSYGTLRTLARRIPEGVAALPLYSTEGGGVGSGAAAAIGAVGAGGTSGGGALALASEQSRGGGPRSELLPYLDTAISSLINCDEIAWAKRLAQGFGFASVDLHLAEVLEKVASGNHQEALLELTLGRAHPELPTVEDGDAEPLLKSLCTQCSRRVALFCRRCQVFYAVSRTIGMAYRQVSQVDVGELLDRLLSPRPYMGDIALCRSLLSCYPKALNKAMLAEVLAQRFLRSTLNLEGSEWPEEKLDDFVSLLDSSPELLGDAALRGIPHFRQDSMSAELVPAAGGPDEENEPMEEPGSPHAPGALQVPLPLECEAEVLVMAYRAYVQACHERSIGELLQFLERRAEVYVEHGCFALLVRLLVAIPEYHAMEYMFGYLVRHGQLDLLLEKGRVRGRVEPALPVALVRYLHDHFPRNLELLAKVHRCFGLEAQLADLLGHKAKVLSKSIGRQWEQICSEEGEEKLLMCLSLFLQCSRFYLRGKRYQKHLVANELAALISLQLKAVQIHLAASLQEQQQQAAAAALRQAERAEREALMAAQARRDEATAALTAELEAAVLPGAAPDVGLSSDGRTAMGAADGLNTCATGSEADVSTTAASDADVSAEPQILPFDPSAAVHLGVAGLGNSAGVLATPSVVEIGGSVATPPSDAADLTTAVSGAAATTAGGSCGVETGETEARFVSDPGLLASAIVTTAHGETSLNSIGISSGEEGNTAVDDTDECTAASPNDNNSLAASISSVAKPAPAVSAGATTFGDVDVDDVSSAASPEGLHGGQEGGIGTALSAGTISLGSGTGSLAVAPLGVDHTGAPPSFVSEANGKEELGSSAPLAAISQNGGASTTTAEIGAVTAASTLALVGDTAEGGAQATDTLEDDDALLAEDGGVSGGVPLGPMGDPFVVINLEAAEVRVFTEYHHDFVAAFQVVSAYRHTYGPSLSTVWPRALYRQVVLLGNHVYLQQFMLHMPLTREVLEAAAVLYVDEPCPEQFPLRAQRMKQFLREGVPNLEMLYQLTRSLGPEFSDIAMETASLVYMA